jgi:hypothetical protein
MKFVAGKRPEWKGKPKASPLDTDVDFLQLRTMILGGRMKPFEEAGMLIHESTDGVRLNAKNPARLVRDHLRRILKESKLEPDFEITCRLTATPGEWGVWVKHLPREMALSEKADRHRQEKKS